MHLLHLEDSQTDAELFRMLLQREWPDCAICHVSNAPEYRTALDRNAFDIILSDYSLPGFDGLTALAMAREKCPQTPFVFLSGTIGEERAVEALRQGATDYVIKDRPSRLVPAIRQAIALIDEGNRRRDAEESVRQHEERFREITENVADLIAVLDRNGRRVYLNPAYGEVLAEPSQLMGTLAANDVHVQDRAAWQEAFDDSLRSGQRKRFAYRLLRPDGTIRHIESHTSVLRDAMGNVTHVLEVSRDITSRRQAELRLREQASLLDKARDAIFATDLDHRITYWNASAERLYGLPSAEVAGRRLDRIGLGFDPNKFGEARAHVLASGEWRGEFRLQTKSGNGVVVESTWSLVLGDAEPRSILYIDTDVTERRKLETQLLRSQRLESIGTLAGGVAHDLNNVLTPILLTVDLLAAKLNSAEDRELISKTKACVNHGAALVQQLLAFARGGEARRTRIDPRAALMDVQGLVGQSLPATIQLTVRNHDDPWPIEADATQFKQVVLNLCINARDAMPRGGKIEIAVRNVTVDQTLAAANPGCAPGRFLRVSVTDTGSGIPADIIEKIFDPFFTTKPAGKGTGLGLSMVAGIVKSHGGFVQVESPPGKGATFHLHFPALAVDSVEAPPAKSRFSGGNGEGILLIDDEPVVRQTLQMLLQRAGYRVFPAADGGSGVAEFERHEKDIALVITDMMLPDQVGTEVVKTLRGRHANLPIIAISGMMASGEFDELHDYHPEIECLAKPLAPTVLLGAVRRRLGVGRS